MHIQIEIANVRYLGRACGSIAEGKVCRGTPRNGIVFYIIAYENSDTENDDTKNGDTENDDTENGDTDFFYYFF